jgi:putative transcriptional regulator
MAKRSQFFMDLHASVKEMDQIVRGERKPSRVFDVQPEGVKELRARIGLSQPKFAALLNIEVGTLRNWEQGIRKPSGPAQALLTAIRKDPENVLKALAS